MATFWTIVTALALVSMVNALLDRRPPPPSRPSLDDDDDWRDACADCADYDYADYDDDTPYLTRQSHHYRGD